MRYFALIVSVLLAVSMWGCDEMMHLDPVLPIVEDPEDRVDALQTTQLIRALADKIRKLESELGKDPDPVLQALVNLNEPLDKEEASRLIKALNERFEKLEEEYKNTGAEGAGKKEDLVPVPVPVPAPEPDPLPGLAIGDRVISQNTISDDGRLKGVWIREDPEIVDGNHRNRAIFNGATGTVIGGPVEASGFTWWKIHWDAGQTEDEIVCHGENPCIGWSAEIINNAVILAEQ